MLEEGSRSLSVMNSEKCGLIFFTILEIMKEVIEDSGIYDIRPIAVHRVHDERYEADIEFLPEDLNDNVFIHVKVKGEDNITLIYSDLSVRYSISEIEEICEWLKQMCEILKRSGRLWRYAYDAS